MNNFKSYLNKHGIPFKAQDDWSLIFAGNHSDGVYIAVENINNNVGKAIQRNGLHHEWRGNYSALYVKPTI